MLFILERNSSILKFLIKIIQKFVNRL